MKHSITTTSIIVITTLLAAGVLLSQWDVLDYEFRSVTGRMIHQGTIDHSMVMGREEKLLPHPDAFGTLPTATTTAYARTSLVDLPSRVHHDVPFVPQAPFGNWTDPRQDYGCEEASGLMALHWITGEPLTYSHALDVITEFSDWEKEMYGEFHDTSIADSAARFSEYLGLTHLSVYTDITADDIRHALAAGNLVIVPLDGRTLDNPYYTPPGPINHMLVIVGYDDVTEEFITHDPGTRRGADIRFSYDNFMLSLRDYPTGHAEPNPEHQTAMIVVEKNM